MSKKILIIEDDQDIIDIMTYILEDEGFTVVSQSGIGTIADIVQLEPMLILMDNQLKDGQGTDLCKTLKDNPSTAHLTVVLVSANLDIEKMAVEACADGLLKKPFSIEEFVSIVKKMTKPACEAGICK